MPVNKVPFRVKSNKQLVKKSAENLRLKVPKIAKSRLKTAATDLKKRMSKPGKKMKYPVNWDSRKQMLAVITKLRKSGNLPYKRKRTMQRGWNVVELKSGYSIENKVKGSKHVYGDMKGQKQSRIHAGRWPEFQRQTEIVLNALPKSVQKAMVDVLKDVSKTKAPVK